jgi:hypothetical protein
MPCGKAKEVSSAGGRELEILVEEPRPAEPRPIVGAGDLGIGRAQPLEGLVALAAG